jgi:hypothetical protein
MWFFRTAVRVSLVQDPLETILNQHLTFHRQLKVFMHTPVGQLLMPNQVMASQLLAIGLRKIGNDIALGKGELTLGRLGCVPLSIPFH